MNRQRALKVLNPLILVLLLYQGLPGCSGSVSTSISS
jgi:hypothetical protein